jgi:hypothetical protein
LELLILLHSRALSDRLSSLPAWPPSVRGRRRISGDDLLN